MVVLPILQEDKEAMGRPGDPYAGTASGQKIQMRVRLDNGERTRAGMPNLDGAGNEQRSGADGLVTGEIPEKEDDVQMGDSTLSQITRPNNKKKSTILQSSDEDDIEIEIAVDADEKENTKGPRKRPYKCTKECLPAKKRTPERKNSE